MENAELINKLKSGEEEAFRTVVNEYQRLILNCCFKFTKNAETSEDITQEVFIEVFRSVKKFRAESNLLTWIYRIAITKSLDYLKSQRRKKRFAAIKSLFEEDGVETNIQSTDSEGPERVLEDKDRMKVLSWAMDSLPEKQKIAFTLSKYDEMSYKEIADILNSSISSVESLIFRARTNLKKKLYFYYKKQL